MTDQLSQQLIDTSVWSDDDVMASGIDVEEAWIVSIGGGLGSFALAHVLRVFGLPVEGLTVIGDGEKPARTYRYLARNSQIPDSERLRSDAGSTMDSIWGFPSYAWREALSEPGLANKVAPLWQVLTEPLLSDYYTPKAGQVYQSVDRETGRIGWDRMINVDSVRLVRRRAGGGYFTVTRPDPATGRRRAFRSRFVHVAVGYPGVRFLRDLQEYREAHSDYSRVVNAYEPHDQVYEELRRRPSTVLVRGSGIVASRILQRLIDDRDKFGRASCRERV